MGSIQKRGEGTYYLTVSAKYGLNGKRQRFTKTVKAKDEKAAQKLLNQFQVEVESTLYVKPEKLLFERFANDWLEKYAKTNLAPRTYQRYKELLDLRIIPAFKLLRLEQIKPMHLLQFYENLQERGIRLDKGVGKKEKGLSERTIKHHHRLLSTMFAHAVEWQLLSDNPAKRVKPPKVTDVEAKFYNETEIMTLIEKLNLAPPKYMTMIILTIFTGLSRGEIMGLTWDDVNIDDNTISIRQSAQYIRGQGVSMKSPKNKYRARTIAIPDFVMAILSIHKTIQSEDRLKLEEIYNDNRIVFAQDNGKPMHPDTITKWFREFLKDNKLPPITFHGLRHSHATILIANNTDILTVSRRLGHNKTSTTLDIYGHAIQNSERATSDKLSNILTKHPKKDELSSNCHQDSKKAST